MKLELITKNDQNKRLNCSPCNPDDCGPYCSPSTTCLPWCDPKCNPDDVCNPKY